MSQDSKSPYQLNRCEQLLVSKILEKTNLKLTHLLNGIAQQMAHLIKRKLIKSPADKNVIIESIPFIKKYQITCDICGYDVHNSDWLQTFVNSSKFQEIQNSEAENFGIGTLSLKSKKIIIVVICAQFNVQIDRQKMINVINHFPPNSIQIDKQQFLKKINEFRKQHSLSEILLVQSISCDKKPTDLKIFTVCDVPNSTDDFLFCLSQRPFADFILSPIHEIQLDVVSNDNSTYTIIIKTLFDYQNKSTQSEIEQEPIDFESEQDQPPVIEEHNETKANELQFHDEEPADDEDFDQNGPLTEKSSERNNVEYASNINKEEDQLNEQDETIEEEESDDSDTIQPIPPQSVNDNVNQNEQKDVIAKLESDGVNEIQPGHTNSNQNISDGNQVQIEEEESDNSDPIQPIPPQSVNDNEDQNEQNDVIEEEESDNSDSNPNGNIQKEEKNNDQVLLNTTNNNIISFPTEHNEKKDVIEKVEIDPNELAQPVPPTTENEINPKEKVDLDLQLNEKQENSQEQPNATSLSVSQPQSTEEVKATPKEITTPSVPKTSSIPLTPQNSNDTLKTPEDCISLALTTIQQKLRNLDTQLDPVVTSKLQAYLEENNEFFYENVRPQFLKAQFSSMIPHYEYSYIFGSQSYQYLRKDLIEKIMHYGNVAAIACTRTFSRDGAPSTRFNIVLLIQRKDKKESTQNSNNSNFVTTPKKDRQQMKSRSSTPRKDSILAPIEHQIVHQLSTIANSFEVIEEYTPKLRTLLQETNGNKQAIIDKAQNEFPSVSYIFIRLYFRLSHDELLKRVHTEYSRLDKLQYSIVGVGAICADDNPTLFTAAVFTGKRGGTPRKNGSLATSQQLSTPKPETPKSMSQSQQYKSTPKSASRKVPNDYERSRLILSSLNEHRKKKGLPEAKLVPGLLPIAEEYARDMGKDQIIMHSKSYEERAKQQFPQYHNILGCGMCKTKNSSYIERMFEHPDHNFLRILDSPNENISIGYWNKEKESVYMGIFSWTDK